MCCVYQQLHTGHSKSVNHSKMCQPLCDDIMSLIGEQVVKIRKDERDWQLGMGRRIHNGLKHHDDDTIWEQVMTKARLCDVIWLNRNTTNGPKIPSDIRKHHISIIRKDGLQYSELYRDWRANNKGRRITSMGGCMINQCYKQIENHPCKSVAINPPKFKYIV